MLACQTIFSAAKNPVSCSINDLLIEYNYPENSLDGLKAVLETLEYFNIRLDPPIDEHDLDFQRTLKPTQLNHDICNQISEIILNGGENHLVELKSSIIIDTNHKAHAPGKEIDEYVSGKLKKKLAQEIGAFLNRDGGKILLGVSNDLTLLGCSDDFEAYPGDGTPEDKADLIIRMIVEQNFVKPIPVLAHMQVLCTNYNGHHLVLLNIAKMSDLAFLKDDNNNSTPLYIRLGTSAEPINFNKIEEYFTLQYKSK